MTNGNLTVKFNRELKDVENLSIISAFDYNGGYGEFSYMLRLAKQFNYIDEETEQIMLSLPEYKPRYDFFKYKESYRTEYIDAAFSISPVKSIAVSRFMEILKTLYGYQGNELWNSKEFWTNYAYRGFKVLERYFSNYKQNGNRLPVEMGYVYVIDAGNDYIKIGKTINPDQRIKQISPKMPFDCEYRHIFPTYFMSLGEKLLHKKFEDFRSNGEWFHSCEDILTWLKYDGRKYTELAFFSSLHEELMRIPEIRLARLFDDRVTFDPRDIGWKVFENFRHVYEELSY